jgi:catechol 2,3-dioxygenase-like lactoylglutathione lyase family enzyme
MNMAAVLESAIPVSSRGAVPVKGLHHFAWRCRDAEETRVFYEDLLGLPLVHLIRLDHVPSTGEFCPYVHIFFQLGDGSYIAFFDLGDDQASDPSPNTPAWVNHIAFEVATREHLETAKARLEAAGVEVLGITDHHFINSIYFFDPNGIRLELTIRLDPPKYMDDKKKLAHEEIAAWSAEKARRRASGEIPAQP